MKLLILLVVSILSVSNGFSQQTNQPAALMKQDYLQKSKKQKTKAWILLSGGAALIATGYLIPEGEIVDYSWNFTVTHENDDIRGAFFLAGLVSAIASIPFFISAGNNRQRAAKAKASLNIISGKMASTAKAVPIISLKIDF